MHWQCRAVCACIHPFADCTLCFYICPLFNCVRPMHALAMQSSVCAFTHLLSSNCTSYFLPLHHFICAYCKCISLVVQLVLHKLIPNIQVYFAILQPLDMHTLLLFLLLGLELLEMMLSPLL